MCFYRDTQSVLAKNTLRQFFINKVAEHKEQQDLRDVYTKSLPYQVNNVLQGEEPYKKIQISSDLFKDLLKLSHGDTTLANELESGNDKTFTQKSAENDNISNTLLTITTKFEENEETQMEPEQNPEKSFNELLRMVESTNKKLMEHQSAQDHFLKKVQEIANEVRNKDVNESPFERLNRMSCKQKETLKPSKSPSYGDMLSLFTNGRTSFPFALRLSTKLPSPILREKNVKISVELVRSSDGALIENHGSMLLQISLFTWELPTNPILRNRAGNKVLQGEDECELKNGQGSFDKLQINEVTSKFINGYIAVLIVPKRPINFGTSLESLQQKKLFRIQDIKPLLVEKVVIKSKKKSPKGHGK